MREMGWVNGALPLFLYRSAASLGKLWGYPYNDFADRDGWSAAVEGELC